jgi:predicted heme/steroid binding protein
MQHDDNKDETAEVEHKHSTATKKRGLFKRFPLVVFALVIAVVMIGGSLLYANQKKQDTAKNNGGLDTAKILHQPVTIPPSAPNKEFTAETIKQYDGQDGHKCYVAVKGVVYEIAGKTQWQNGQHQPSSGQAYCGADMTSEIDKAPHGDSKLQELPKVGTFKSS